MDKGILYVAFGADYVRLMEATRAITKRHTDLPVHVLTNVKGVSDSTYFDLPQSENREIKTSMVRYTPFDTTLYIDIDTIFQQPFTMPDFDGLLVNRMAKWEADKLPNIYRKHMKICGVEPPIDVFNGAFLGFKKSDTAFFDLWSDNWNKCGRGREMPSLCCAIKSSGINTTYIPGLFSFAGFDAKATIQHDVGSDFFERFSLPRPLPHKPFDTDPTDWHSAPW